MFKKCAVLIACLALSAVVPTAAQATTGWYFFIHCAVPALCGSLSHVYGPYDTVEQCEAAADYMRGTPWGSYPMSTSNCYEQ